MVVAVMVMACGRYGWTPHKPTYKTTTPFQSHCHLKVVARSKDVIQPKIFEAQPHGGDSRVVTSRTSKQEGPGSIPGGGK